MILPCVVKLQDIDPDYLCSPGFSVCFSITIEDLSERNGRTDLSRFLPLGRVFRRFTQDPDDVLTIRAYTNYSAN